MKNKKMVYTIIGSVLIVLSVFGFIGSIAESAANGQFWLDNFSLANVLMIAMLVGGAIVLITGLKMPLNNTEAEPAKKEGVSALCIAALVVGILSVIPLGFFSYIIIAAAIILAASGISTASLNFQYGISLAKVALLVSITMLIIHILDIVAFYA